MQNHDPGHGVGLVLSGGGGKGAYEIGVWQALEEYGVTPNIKAISGTSVGALNTVLFAQGDLALARGVWSNISPEAVMTVNSRRIAEGIAHLFAGTVLADSLLTSMVQLLYQRLSNRYADQGILSKEGLSNLINGTIDPKRVHGFAGPIYVAAFHCSARQVRYFNLKDHTTLAGIRDRLLASASIPVIFGKTYVDGDMYWDGGLPFPPPFAGDNTPVKPLYDDGYRNLVVVHLSREEPVDRGEFPGCHIIEIMPQEDLGGLASGTMNFKPEVAMKNMERGYNDAVRLLEPFFKTGLALERLQQAFQTISEEQRRFAVEKRRLDQELEQSNRDIQALSSQLN